MDSVGWVGTFAKWLVAFVLAFCVGLAAVVASAQPAAPQPPHAVLVFSATWCPSCQALKPQLAAVGDKRFVVMDVDKFPALTKTYRVEKIPTIIAVNAQQREVKRALASGWTAEMLTDFGK